MIQVEDAQANAKLVDDLTKVLIDGNAALVRAYALLAAQIERAATPNTQGRVHADQVDEGLDLMTKLSPLVYLGFVKG